VPPPGALLRAGDQEELHVGLGKDDASLIAALGDEVAELPADPPLKVHQHRADRR